MAYPLIQLDGRQVICSGSVLARKGEKISINPFEALPDDRLHFKIVIIEDDAAYNAVSEIVDDNLEVIYYRPWAQGAISANYGVQFQVDGSDIDYSIRFSVDLIGNRDNYVVNFNFTIYEGIDNVG